MDLPHDMSAPSPGIDWRWALPRIAAVFIVTRLLLLGVAVAAEATHPAPPELDRSDVRPILASLTLWDGEYYLGIAEDGYHADPTYGPDYAFYPGYPITVRATSLLTVGDLSVASVVAANVAFALALGALYALSARYLTRERAILALVFLALAPGAISFGLSYSDSLFLLLAVAVFLAAETSHPWLAGIALALATLTRAPGVLLGLPLLVMWIERDGPRPKRTWLSLLLAPLALVVWFGWLWWLTGEPMAAISAQSYWDPPATVSADGPGGSVAPAISHVAGPAPQAVIALWLGSIIFHTFLLVFFRPDRIGIAYWLVAIIGLASIFLAGRLQSAPRYLAVAWPYDWVLANRRSRIGQAVVLAAFVALYILAAWLAFTWQVPP